MVPRLVRRRGALAVALAGCGGARSDDDHRRRPPSDASGLLPPRRQGAAASSGMSRSADVPKAALRTLSAGPTASEKELGLSSNADAGVVRLDVTASTTASLELDTERSSAPALAPDRLHADPVPGREGGRASTASATPAPTSRTRRRRSWSSRRSRSRRSRARCARPGRRTPSRRRSSTTSSTRPARS